MMLDARPGPRPLVSDHLRLFPSMCSDVGMGEINPDPTAAEASLSLGSVPRYLCKISARGGDARSSDHWCLRQAAGASIGRKVD